MEIVAGDNTEEQDESNADNRNEKKNQDYWLDAGNESGLA